MKKTFLLLGALCVFPALAEIDQNVQNDDPALSPLTNLVWHCGPNARIENGILTVDVPPEKAGHGGSAWADFDLVPYRGHGVKLTIRARGERIAEPPQTWLGLKFQFSWVDESGQTHWPNTHSRLGDFPEQEIAVKESFRLYTPTKGRFMLGLQATSGKSAVAALLAREMGAAILNADSMLVYKGMDIGTAKPSPAERAEFRMGGIDLVTPAEEFSAGAWLRAAAAWAETIPADTPIVIVGGTGLYFSALLRGLDRGWTKPPPEYPVLQIDRAVVRARIAARLDDMFLSGLEREKAELHRLYPVWSRTASLAIGYRDGDDHAKIYTRTCQLAKRQDTWFRHQATAIYVPVGATAEETAERVRAVWRACGPWPVTFN